MLVGNPERFAIEAEPREAEGVWTWGGFRFLLGNRSVGNWEDAAALQLCRGWLRKLCDHPQNCTDPYVASCIPEEVFALVVDPVSGPAGIADPTKQPIPFAYERFHITHVGMSSFDSYTVLLIKDEIGNERCLWRQGMGGPIEEQWLRPGEIEGVIQTFCEQSEREWGR